MDLNQASPPSPYDSASPGLGHKAAALALLRLGQPRKVKHRRRLKTGHGKSKPNSGANCSSLARHLFTPSTPTTNPTIGSAFGDGDDDGDDGGDGRGGVPFRPAAPKTMLPSVNEAGGDSTTASTAEQMMKVVKFSDPIECHGHLAPEKSTAKSYGHTGSICLSAASPKLAVCAEQKPLNTLLEHAFHNKGPLDYETMRLITETLADMEEEFDCCDKERSLNWEDVADEFCGCSREDLIKWYINLGPFIQAEENCSPKIMALLLRSFFDHQYSLMDERSMMEKNKMSGVAATVDGEKIRCVEGFLANAEKDFEKALWTYFMRDWIH